MLFHLKNAWPFAAAAGWIRGQNAQRSVKISPAAFEPLESRDLFAGAGLAGAYFARTNQTLAKFARADATINFAWSGGTPASSLGTDGFSTRWSGLILPKFSESHAFILTSTGGVRLWINDKLLIDNWQKHGNTEDRGAIKLSGGHLYSIRLDYWTDGKSPSVKLEWMGKRQARTVVPANRSYPTKLDKVAPTAPTRLRALSTNSNTIQIGWDASKDPSGVVAYDVYVGKTKVMTTAPGEVSYLRNNLSAATGYTFSIQAIDAAGNLSKLTATAVTTAAAPARPPSVPQGLHVTAVGEDTVSLAWNASTDDGVVTGYRIYRNGIKIAAASGTTFTDTGLSPSTTYTYTVRSADNQSLYSKYSSAATATTTEIQTRDPFDGTIAAINNDGASGASQSGSDLINLDNGDWVRFNNLNFGSGAQSVMLSLALDPNNRGGTIELHIGSVSGTKVGELKVQPTGSWNTYRNQQVNVSGLSGTHDLFVVFKGRTGVANFRSIQFSTQHLTTIMALGDSITQQNASSPSYRYYLWQLLQQAGYPLDFVGSQQQAWGSNVNPPNFDFDQDHEGHAGIHADEIAADVAGWVQANRPDVVLLMAGINDLKDGQGVNSTISDIGQIINNIRSVNPDVKIVLAKLVPSVGMDVLIDQFNDKIEDLGNSTTTAQSPVTVVDMNTNFPSNGLSSDGIHTTDPGDEFLATQWAFALASILG
jgi:chitodextrinase/lysophospholipase L1-like esterase